MSVFDIRVLKALGSPTRLRILMQLGSGHMTLSDLSSCFGMHPSSVKGHLDVLSEAGLVRLENGGRKWKYYGLTPAGAGIFAAGEVRVLLPAISGAVLLGASLRGYGSAVVEASPQLRAEAAVSGAAPALAVQAQAQPYALHFALALAGFALVCLSFFLWRRMKARL